MLRLFLLKFTTILLLKTYNIKIMYGFLMENIFYYHMDKKTKLLQYCMYSISYCYLYSF